MPNHSKRIRASLAVLLLLCSAWLFASNVTQPVTTVPGACGMGLFTQGSIFFADGAGNCAEDSNLFWDNTLKQERSGTGTFWTVRINSVDNDWQEVAFGNGLFVAIADTGTGNRVMTSPDGITWTSRTSAADNSWNGLIYGSGLFVAVSDDGASRVMTSPDGITWTSRTAAAANQWNSVAYGNGVFVAVSQSGAGNRVMTSPDGITWTSRTSAADNSWNGLTFGNGLFVATSTSGTGNRVMTSPDGITWTIRTSAADVFWRELTFGDGLFVAVSSSGTGNRVMTSPDGITWTSRTNPTDQAFHGIAFGNGMFVAVADSGTGNRVITSGRPELIPISEDNIFVGGRELRGRWLLDDFSTLVNNDATPTVAAGNLFNASNSMATTITAFDDGLDGQVITIIFTNANTTVTDGGTIFLQGAANFVSSADDTMSLVFNGTNWYEVSRSVN